VPQGRARPGPAAVSGSPEEGALDEGKEGISAEYDGESGDGEREDEGEAMDKKRCNLDGAAVVTPDGGAASATPTASVEAACREQGKSDGEQDKDKTEHGELRLRVLEGEDDTCQTEKVEILHPQDPVQSLRLGINLATPFGGVPFGTAAPFGGHARWGWPCHGSSIPHCGVCLRRHEPSWSWRLLWKYGFSIPHCGVCLRRHEPSWSWRLLWKYGSSILHCGVGVFV
jgi:hypothetical protein